MSAESQWDIQEALYASLQGDTALNIDVEDRIFDHVPEDSIFPYVTLGAMLAEPFDTQINRGLKIRMSLHSFSSYRGMKEIKQIMRSIYNILHEKDDWVIAGHAVVSCRFISSQISFGNDGETRSSIQNFEIITEKTI